MSHQPLDYYSPEPVGKPRVVWIACLVAVAVIAIANAALIGMAWHDQSWGALAIMYAGLPIVNIVLALVFMALTGVVRHEAVGADVSGYVVVSVLGPLLAGFGAFIYLASLPIHGC